MYGFHGPREITLFRTTTKIRKSCHFDAPLKRRLSMRLSSLRLGRDAFSSRNTPTYIKLSNRNLPTIARMPALGKPGRGTRRGKGARGAVVAGSPGTFHRGTQRIDCPLSPVTRGLCNPAAPRSPLAHPANWRSAQSVFRACREALMQGLTSLFVMLESAFRTNYPEPIPFR